MKKLTSTLTTFVFALAIILTANSGLTADCGASHAKTASTAKMANAKMDIVETALSAENFSTLVTAVKAAGLVEALKGEGPFTVFAPTDEAFAKLPKGAIEALLNDKEKLAAVLTYHVVPGKVMASDVVKVDKAQTLNGQDLKVKVDKEMVMVDNANVVATDILCSNGVIHVIDEVILPEKKKKK